MLINIVLSLLATILVTTVLLGIVYLCVIYPIMNLIIVVAVIFWSAYYLIRDYRKFNADKTKN